MFGFNKVEVYMGYSLKDFSKAKEILKNNNITYSYKIEDPSQELMGRGTERAIFGSFGTNAKYEKLYYLSVKKADSERATYLINSEIHAE